MRATRRLTRIGACAVLWLSAVLPGVCAILCRAGICCPPVKAVPAQHVAVAKPMPACCAHEAHKASSESLKAPDTAEKPCCSIVDSSSNATPHESTGLMPSVLGILPGQAFELSQVVLVRTPVTAHPGRAPPWESEYRVDSPRAPPF